VLDTIVSPPYIRNGDIGASAQNIWYGTGDTLIYKINITTKLPTTISTKNYVGAVEWDGSSLWCTNTNLDKIFKIDTVTGNNIFLSSSITSYMQSIAWDGQCFWCSSVGLYKYDPKLNGIISAYGQFMADGLACVDGYLYVCRRGLIYKCSLASMRIVESYVLQNVQAYGIAHNGSNLWISGYEGSSFSTKIYKVAL
jgi:hypothetical protein